MSTDVPPKKRAIVSIAWIRSEAHPAVGWDWVFPSPSESPSFMTRSYRLRAKWAKAPVSRFVFVAIRKEAFLDDKRPHHYCRLDESFTGERWRLGGEPEQPFLHSTQDNLPGYSARREEGCHTESGTADRRGFQECLHDQGELGDRRCRFIGDVGGEPFRSRPCVERPEFRAQRGNPAGPLFRGRGRGGGAGRGG